MLDTREMTLTLPEIKSLEARVPSRLASPKEVIEFVKRQNVQVVDFKFVDLPGTWQHFSIPAMGLDEDVFIDGIGFDGSSIRGFQQIHESDMLLMPDPTSGVMDPVCSVPTLTLTCDVYDPISRSPYSRDPRFIAQKAERYLGKMGIATTSYWGPEAEFFIFDASGTRAEIRAHRTLAIGLDTRRVISPSRRRTACKTSARKSFCG
jgi:glutamine synthetase